MIIEENIKSATFDELNIGDVFRNGCLNYLRIPPCFSNGYSYNSYDLDNNDYCYFPDDEQITLVKAKLVIE